MAQYFAYENKNKDSKKLYPFLLDIQSNLLEDLQTTVVVPLTRPSTAKLTFTKLTPTVELGGINYIALTQQLVGLDREALGQEVADLSIYKFAIIDAIDFIVSGV